MKTIQIGSTGIPSKSSIYLGNKYENNNETLLFEVSDELSTYVKYVIAVIDTGEERLTKIIPVTNNRMDVSTELTYISGTWTMYLMCREHELDLTVAPVDITSRTGEHVFISNAFMGMVNESLIDKVSIDNTPIDTNLTILYDDLLALRNEVQTKLSNGELNGTAGLSAYQIAVQNGFVGTEADWVDSFYTEIEVTKNGADDITVTLIPSRITEQPGSSGGTVNWADVEAGEIMTVVVLNSITATFTQGSTTIYADDSLSSLRSMLVVSAVYNNDTEIVTDYVLTGTLSVGTSVITVTYKGKTTTFEVTVSEVPLAITSIAAVFTPTGDIYATDTLDTLRNYLVVTATYEDNSTASISSYELSGNMSVGTNTITVTYRGKTSTFSVTVKNAPNHVTNGLQAYFDLTTYEDGYWGDLTNLASTDMTGKSIKEVYNESSSDEGLGFIGGEFVAKNTSYMGGLGKRGVIHVFSTDANKVFRDYPHTVEFYSKVGETYPNWIYSTKNSLIDSDMGVGNGTVLYVESNTLLKTAGSIGQGIATFTLSTALDPTSYHHFVLELESSSISLYIDGSLMNTMSVTNNNMTTVLNTIPAVFGGQQNIKLIRLYNRILTAAEVTQNYNDVTGV